MSLDWGAQPIDRRFPAPGYPKIWVLKACIHTPTSLSLLPTPRGRSCESNRRVVLDFNIWCIGLACLELVFHRLPAVGSGWLESAFQLARSGLAKATPPAPRARLGAAAVSPIPRGTGYTPVVPQIPDKHLECGSWARVAREEKGRGANHCMNFSS